MYLKGSNNEISRHYDSGFGHQHSRILHVQTSRWTMGAGASVGVFLVPSPDKSGVAGIHWQSRRAALGWPISANLHVFHTHLREFLQESV